MYKRLLVALALALLVGAGVLFLLRWRRPPVDRPPADDGSGAAIAVPDYGDEWPQFRHGSRPEFLQTLPHVHGTSGFFIARLRTGP